MRELDVDGEMVKAQWELCSDCKLMQMLLDDSLCPFCPSQRADGTACRFQPYVAADLRDRALSLLEWIV